MTLFSVHPRDKLLMCRIVTTNRIHSFIWGKKKKINQKSNWWSGNLGHFQTNKCQACKVELPISGLRSGHWLYMSNQYICLINMQIKLLPIVNNRKSTVVCELCMFNYQPWSKYEQSESWNKTERYKSNDDPILTITTLKSSFCILTFVKGASSKRFKLSEVVHKVAVLVLGVRGHVV